MWSSVSAVLVYWLVSELQSLCLVQNGSVIGILPRVHPFPLRPDGRSGPMWDSSATAPQRCWRSSPWQLKINGMFMPAWWVTSVEIHQQRCLVLLCVHMQNTHTLPLLPTYTNTHTHSLSYPHAQTNTRTYTHVHSLTHTPSLFHVYTSLHTHTYRQTYTGVTFK